MTAHRPRSKSAVTPIRNRTQERAQSRLTGPKRKNISKRKVRSSRRSQSADSEASMIVKRRLDAASVSVQELSSSSPINPQYPLNKNPETISPGQGIAVKMPADILKEYNAFNQATRLGLREFLKLKFGYEKPVVDRATPTSHKRNSRARNKRYGDRQKRKMNRWNRKQNEKKRRAAKKVKAGKK